MDRHDICRECGSDLDGGGTIFCAECAIPARRLVGVRQELQAALDAIRRAFIGVEFTSAQRAAYDRAEKAVEGE